MVFFLIIVGIIIIYGLRICAPACFNGEYLDKKNTTAVNGIFVILIVFSHYAQYAGFSGVYDTAYLLLRRHLGQAVVSPFLFYSGYGMMEAIKRKGAGYVGLLPRKSLSLLLRCDCAVLLYLLLDYAIGDQYPATDILLAFTTWTNIGNSNWYITAVIIVYICMFISFSISMRAFEGRKGLAVGTVLLLMMTAAAVYLQFKAERPDYCYNTMLILPMGCLYSLTKDRIEKLVAENLLTWLLTLVAAAGLYAVSFMYRENSVLNYSLWAYLFMILLLLVTMKVKIYNKVLEWFGRHIFSIYMLQRIPMIILDHFGIVDTYKYTGLIVVFAATVLLALGFERITERLPGIGLNRAKNVEIPQING